MKDLIFGTFCHKSTPNLYNFRCNPQRTFHFDEEIVIQHGRFNQNSKNKFEELNISTDQCFPIHTGFGRRIMREVRSVINKDVNWMDYGSWNRSLWGYGIPESALKHVNSIIGQSVIYTDLFCLLSLNLSSVRYLEIGVSAGKNLLTMLNFLGSAKIVGLDVEEMSGRLRALCEGSSLGVPEGEATSFRDWRGNENSISSGREDFATDSRGNEFSYVRGDKLKPGTWNLLGGMKFSLIFSDALHVPKSIISELDFIIKNEMLSNELIYVWDDVSIGQLAPLRKSAAKLFDLYKGMDPVLVFTNIRGTYGPPRRIAIFCSDRALMPTRLQL
ncbi:hypothetical protein FEM03_06055 [Phragmitibacter flavus]|uniref:Uncharacterized protein n=1 Tax=Phragmitibacter flavus TaxID=2576071 RepID=A0A5R8KHI8_9BACT|nr:hypothetical protein [Phragmitibacter flavus]TLD71700.1 hypothetical protein FEM03_06055 [Phragmitibacter flavus]